MPLHKRTLSVGIKHILYTYHVIVIREGECAHNICTEKKEKKVFDIDDGDEMILYPSSAFYMIELYKKRKE